jgi:hypothetical protein
VLLAAGLGERGSALVGMGLIVGLRVGAIVLGWRLPVLSLREGAAGGGDPGTDR